MPTKALGTTTAPSRQMLKAMLQLQDSMNRKINPDWMRAEYPFLRAIVVEAAEGLEHYGWKWWKSQSPDMAQLRIELVDIWHFLLSNYLAEAKGNLTLASESIIREWSAPEGFEFDGRQYQLLEFDIRRGLELLAALAASRRTVTPLLAHLFDLCSMTPQDLFREYVSKNVLNHFRQDHGYKTGAYLKIWNGREDNVHLAEILAALTSDDEGLPKALYDALETRYREIRGAGDGPNAR
jgi:dimeric dUTPase (all-alpha-NTP-PPase superfamily)